LLERIEISSRDSLILILFLMEEGRIQVSDQKILREWEARMPTDLEVNMMVTRKIVFLLRKLKQIQKMKKRRKRRRRERNPHHQVKVTTQAKRKKKNQRDSKRNHPKVFLNLLKRVKEKNLTQLLQLYLLLNHLLSLTCSTP